jgi:hypothetical protein
VKGRAVLLPRTIICIVSWVLGLLLAGCSGWGIAQQPRLQIAEPAKGLIIRSHGLYMASPRLALTQQVNGAVAVRAFPPSPEKWTHQTPAPDDAVLDHVHDALLPFLVPSCEAVR